MQSVTCSALNAASPQNYSFHQNFHPSGLLTFAESHGADEIVFSMFKLAHGSTWVKLAQLTQVAVYMLSHSDENPFLALCSSFIGGNSSSK